MCSCNCNDGLDCNCDQNNFNPKEYLETYYTQVDDENRCLLEFWDTMYPLAREAQILEIGCGPTIFTAIPLAWRVRHITLTDSLKDNLAEINKWKNYAPDSFDWSLTIEFYRKHSLHRLNEMFLTQTALSDVINHRTSTLQFDVHKDVLVNQYDAIVTSFCLAEACCDWDDFASTLHQLIQSVKENGTFGLVTAIDSHQYTIGDTIIPMARITVDRLYNLFISHFSEVHLRLIPIDMDRGYTKIAGIWGRHANKA